ncbi:aminotransferase class III-fold pyridoxal phosphate-dependent enzyme [Verminephrobacter eiseniae]|nr:aminotransferase class III-fold pyridoxal phosphate-dependent enzyme [Verminephrobacter eiseniae]MCW5238237.1 aminotransferase class III-fold pyridoxal phosphate-dependent enzyme [Verminephrobacter eiseniae]
MCDFHAARAESASLWRAEGREHIDFAAGIAVVNTGRRHPRIVAAIQAQFVIDDERLGERSALPGDRLLNRRLKAKESNPAIADMRAQGSIVALELRDAAGEPGAAAVRRLQKRALAQGLRLSGGMHGNVIRFPHPLTIPDASFDRALDIVDMVLQA